LTLLTLLLIATLLGILLFLVMGILGAVKPATLKPVLATCFIRWDL
jgi:hypothetical protein